MVLLMFMFTSLLQLYKIVYEMSIKRPLHKHNQECQKVFTLLESHSFADIACSKWKWCTKYCFPQNTANVSRETL